MYLAHQGTNLAVMGPSVPFKAANQFSSDEVDVDDTTQFGTSFNPLLWGQIGSVGKVRKR